MTIEHAAVGASPWGRRVGDVSARWLISAARTRVVGVVTGVCALILIALSVVMLERDGQSMPFALVLSFAVVAAIVSGSFFLTSVRLYWPAVDAAFDLLQHRIDGLTGEQVRRALRSPGVFDATLAPRLVESGPAPFDRAWVAGVPRPILAGVSQRQLRTVAIVVLGLGALCAVSLASLGATGHFPPMPLWGRLWSVGGAIIALGVVLRLAAAVRRVQEFRAGYSTVWAALTTRSVAIAFDVRHCVDLVDARSGMLLRRAGQAPISSAVYRDRRHQVREQFPEARPTRL